MGLAVRQDEACPQGHSPPV